MKKSSSAALGLFPILVLMLMVGCAAGPNLLKNSPGPTGSTAGFWLGIWHGFILPFAFIASLVSDKITIYEVHNSGIWYNFGFLMGSAMIWGGGGGASTRRR